MAGVGQTHNMGLSRVLGSYPSPSPIITHLGLCCGLQPGVPAPAFTCHSLSSPQGRERSCEQLSQAPCLLLCSAPFLVSHLFT